MKTVIFKGLMEGVFGYGIECYADTQEECLQLMKDEYAKWLEGNEERTFQCDFDVSAYNRAARIIKITLPCSGYEKECGEAVWCGDDQPAPKVCPECRDENNPSREFCRFCGQNISNC